MKKRKTWVLVGVIFSALLFLPAYRTEAADGKARLLEITRGDYENDTLNLTPGPQNDGKNVKRVLEEAYQEKLVYSVQKEKEGVKTVDGVKQSVEQAFRDSTEEDINYFYYSGHGVMNGLYLDSRVTMSAAELADAFKNVKGCNIILMDCCYSGGMADRTTRSVTSEGESFADCFVEEFQAAVEGQRKSRSALTNQKFKLLVASSKEEVAYQMNYDNDKNLSLGGFSATFSYGAGIDPLKVQQDSGYQLRMASADYDQNGEISFAEMSRYLENTYHYNANHVRTYPEQDESCLLPVAEEKIPEITFERAFVDEEKKQIQITYHAKKELPVDYMICYGNENVLGQVTEQFEMTKEWKEYGYSNLFTVDTVYGQMLPAEKEGQFTLSLENWSDGNYYIMLQNQEQPLRWFLPFCITTEEKISLADCFAVRLSGSSYKEQIFSPEQGEELQIQADFGATFEQNIAKPYVSCTILNGKDHSFVKKLGDRELMQVVGTGTGNGFLAGNCYRSFYWDGTDRAGLPAEDGIYIAQVIAEGAVQAEKEIRFELKSPIVNRAKISDFTISSEEYSLPLEDGEQELQAEFSLEYDGELSVEICRGKDTVYLLYPRTKVQKGVKTIKWNGLLQDGLAAPQGEDYSFKIWYQPDNGMEAITTARYFNVKNRAPKKEPESETGEGEKEVPVQDVKDKEQTATEKETQKESEPPQTEPQNQPVEVTVRVQGKAVEKLVAGKKEKIFFTTEPVSGFMGKEKITYASSDKKILTVSAGGKLKAKAVGKAKLLVKVGSRTVKEISVTVKKAPNRITFRRGQKVLKTGKKYKLKVKLPVGTASSRIRFQSSRKAVVTVDEQGNVRTIKKGSAIITAKTYNGKKAKIKIVVK